MWFVTMVVKTSMFSWRHGDKSEYTMVEDLLTWHDLYVCFSWGGGGGIETLTFHFGLFDSIFYSCFFQLSIDQTWVRFAEHTLSECFLKDLFCLCFPYFRGKKIQVLSRTKQTKLTQHQGQKRRVSSVFCCSAGLKICSMRSSLQLWCTLPQPCFPF